MPRTAKDVVWAARTGARDRRVRRRLEERFARDGVTLGPASQLSATTTVGRGTGIHAHARVLGEGRVTIGAYCAIGEYFRVLTNNHSFARPNIHDGLQRRLGRSPAVRAEDVTVGSACWIGDGVRLLPGAHVGHGCVVAAGSVVPRGVYEPFTILAGVPARKIGERCSRDVAEALLEVAWWNWPSEVIETRAAFFDLDISASSADDIRLHGAEQAKPPTVPDPVL